MNYVEVHTRETPARIDVRLYDALQPHIRRSDRAELGGFDLKMGRLVSSTSSGWSKMQEETLAAMTVDHNLFDADVCIFGPDKNRT